MSQAQPPRKFIPLNLTARSDLVRGNPVTARPESGADNAHPGLEFDTRILSRAFFPGLVFDFHYGVGAKLVEVRPELSDRLGGLESKHIGQATNGIFLWYIVVHEPREAHEVYNLDGYNVLRIVNSLEKGDLIVVVGPRPEDVSPETAKDVALLVSGLLFNPESWQTDSKVVAPDGQLQVAVLSGKRAEYLDPEGVIDTAAIRPGELTQSLCSPWQWDFAECACYYWAASRPDIVAGEEPGQQPKAAYASPSQSSPAVLFPPEQKFLLDRSQPAVQPHTQAPSNVLDAWNAGQLTPPKVILQWESLPVILNDREANEFEPSSWPQPRKILSFTEVIARLGDLARIEHAVLVEYLYAAYSINAPLMPANPANSRVLSLPRSAPPQFRSQQEKDFFAAANEILMIAIEEMRHFRWVNEVRLLLDAGAELGRADFIGPENRKSGRDFKPQPLTKKVLKELIDVEAPSRQLAGTDDVPEGLYTQLLLNIHQWPEQQYPDKSRIMEIIKTIIDEGHDHFRRLLNVQSLLAPYEDNEYLRVRGGPGGTSGKNPELRALADQHYDEILTELRLVLRRRRSEVADPQGVILGQARRAMFNLHEIAVRLAQEGEGVPFNLPSWLKPA